MDKVRVAILGAGKIGQIHASAYQKIEGVEVASVTDIKAQAANNLAQQVGARALTDIQGAIRDPEINTVDICLPTFLHEECVIAAARQRKHLICEKPVALTIQAIDRMLDELRGKPIHSMVAQVVRFNPEYSSIRDHLLAGEVGDPMVAFCTRRAEMPDWGAWFKDPEKSGAALFDLHIHDIDYIYSLFGMPQTVYALGQQGESGGWNHVLSSLDYSSIKVVVECSYLAPVGYPFQMGLRLLGNQGAIEYAYYGGQVDQRESAQRGVMLYQAGQAPRSIPRTKEDGFSAELRYFINCLLNDQPVEIATFQQAREVLTIVHAIKQSLESRAVIVLR